MLIRTERLVLRPLRVDDEEALHRVLGDPIAMPAYEHGFSPEETRTWIARQIERYARDGFGLWAMVDADSGEVLGDAGITLQPLEGEEIIEVGYHLRRDAWGRGLATEAARACVDWAFRELDVDEVYAKVRDTNIASMNVAIRLGMTIRRAFTSQYYGLDMPHYAFAISRAAWERGAEEEHRAERRGCREGRTRGVFEFLRRRHPLLWFRARGGC